MKMNIENSAIQSHLTILQGVISRMATNSSSCKTWCVTLVSAILSLSFSGQKFHIIVVALFPIVVFGLLDAYYLFLEASFRKQYNSFVNKIHKSELQTSDLYAINSPGQSWAVLKGVLKSSLSFSVAPFYILQVVVIYIILIKM
jgi:hypothetical protein